MDGIHSVSAFLFPTALSELNIQAKNRLIAKLVPHAVESLPLSVLPDVPHEAEWISGVGMLVRTAVFEQIGGFDEGFFLYFEEIDFCRRAKRAGWKSYSVVTAPLTHIGSVSTGMDEKELRRMPRYWFDSPEPVLHQAPRAGLRAVRRRPCQRRGAEAGQDGGPAPPLQGTAPVPAGLRPEQRSLPVSP